MKDLRFLPPLLSASRGFLPWIGPAHGISTRVAVLVKLIVACTLLPLHAGAQVSTDPTKVSPVVRDAAGREYARETGRVRVPENRQKSDGRSIELGYVRVKSPAQEPGPPLVFLAGGPGQAATPLVDDPEALSEWARILARSDVVFLDQRGTGSSTPNLELPFDESLPEGFFERPEVALAYEIDARARCQKHFAEQGIDLAAYNVDESADDVDAVRAELNVPQIDLLGFSFGTVLGLDVLRRHPSGVRRAVLLGTEAPEDWGSLPTTLQIQLEKIARLAAQDPAVNHAVPDMMALLERVLKKLASTPLRVDVRDRRTDQTVNVAVGRFGLEVLLRVDLGDGNDFPRFPALLWTIDQGRTDMLRPLLERRYNQFSRGVSGMAIAMRQSYGPSAWLPTRIAAEQGTCTLEQSVNYFDLEVRDVTSIPVLGAGFQEPFVCDVPTLFVSGTLDSNAPPYQAEKVRYGFLNGVHLVVDNAGHEDLMPDPNVQAVVARFLAGEDVSTARVARPKPKFWAIRKQP